METVPLFYRQGKRVVDLSADFRFKDPGVYEKWYQKHTAPDLLPESVYGLPELHRDKIRNARIVGNPGCYPTGALIGLIPLVKKGLISLGYCRRFEIWCQRSRQGCSSGVSLL